MMTKMGIHPPITDKRGRVVHFATVAKKPLCRPNTRVQFHATLIGTGDSNLCETCADRDLRIRYENGER